MFLLWLLVLVTEMLILQNKVIDQINSLQLGELNNLLLFSYFTLREVHVNDAMNINFDSEYMKFIYLNCGRNNK